MHPVILVPGDGGSQVSFIYCSISKLNDNKFTYFLTYLSLILNIQVEGRLTNKTSTVHYICEKNSDWFSLWLNLEQMIPELFLST